MFFFIIFNALTKYIYCLLFVFLNDCYNIVIIIIIIIIILSSVLF